jgi:hypothetical protein
VDTVCLAESAGRTTPKDLEMIEKIEAKIPESDRAAVFDEMMVAKNDIASKSFIPTNFMCIDCQIDVD